jgi:hypothetical protein
MRGPIVEHLKFIPAAAHQAIAAYYNLIAQATQTSGVWLALDISAPLHATYLTSAATYHKYVIRNGRRFTATYRERNATTRNSALIKARVEGSWCYGEILTIFEHTQPGTSSTLFAECAWFDTVDTLPIPENIWADLYAFAFYSSKGRHLTFSQALSSTSSSIVSANMQHLILFVPPSRSMRSIATLQEGR